MRLKLLIAVPVVVLAVATAAPSALVASSASAAVPIRYVALGDSSAAGPLIPNQIDATCLRSDHDWPHVLAGRLNASLTDVTCSGARIPDLTGRQFATVAPQFNALRSDTNLVTLAIGANDINLASAFVACANTVGPTCRERFTVNGVDQFDARVNATAPALGAALTEIHRRSPSATVLVTGYLTYWRPNGCYPDDPYRPADANYIQEKGDRVAMMLARQSAMRGATYVDIRVPSMQHGLCEAPAQRWLEGAAPASPAYPYHPNATGMANVAQILNQALGQTVRGSRILT